MARPACHEDMAPERVLRTSTSQMPRMAALSTSSSPLFRLRAHCIRRTTAHCTASARHLGDIQPVRCGRRDFQYLDRVLGVSSSGAAPPYAGYHPLNILGPPDCSTAVPRCNRSPWVTDPNIYPEIGQRLLHARSGDVTGYDATAETVSIEYHEMYKQNASTGVWERCVIDPLASAKDYPSDCLTADLHRLAINQTTGRLHATVPRSEISRFGEGVWSPLNSDYVGTTQMAGGGAFGPQYAFAHAGDPVHGGSPPHRMDRSPSKRPYTVQLIGSPRGMGAIVAIDVEDPTTGTWLSPFRGVPQISMHAHTKLIQYSPHGRRCAHTLPGVQIPAQTGPPIGTGIPSWNYIDWLD